MGPRPVVRLDGSSISERRPSYPVIPIPGLSPVARQSPTAASSSRRNSTTRACSGVWDDDFALLAASDFAGLTDACRTPLGRPAATSSILAAASPVGAWQHNPTNDFGLLSASDFAGLTDAGWSPVRAGPLSTPTSGPFCIP